MRYRVGITVLALAAMMLPTVFASYTPTQEYPLSFVMGDANGLSPADGIVYYFGLHAGADATNTVDGGWRVLSPVTGNVVRAYGVFLVAGTLGSNQNVTVTVRNVTANSTQDITTTSQWTAATNTISNTAMTLAVTAGDLLLIKITSPTWGTNPTSVQGRVTVVVRSSS